MLRKALSEKDEVNIVVATGTSQFEMLSHLAHAQGIDWHRINGFHLDEYVGLPLTHAASFRMYLWVRFIRELPLPMKAFHYINGEDDAHTEADRISQVLARHPIDVAFIGIGENGHLAFNDPPADFETDQPFIVVELDEACRRQQFGEGWFPSLDDVPHAAISMSIRQIMKSANIICTAPEARKSRAVQGTVEGKLTPLVPGSILQKHPSCWIFLDEEAAVHLTSSSQNQKGGPP